MEDGKGGTERVYLGNLPIMTPQTGVVSGAPRHDLDNQREELIIIRDC